jgi:hypothetical protein
MSQKTTTTCDHCKAHTGTYVTAFGNSTSLISETRHYCEMCWNGFAAAIALGPDDALTRALHKLESAERDCRTAETSATTEKARVEYLSKEGAAAAQRASVAERRVAELEARFKDACAAQGQLQGQLQTFELAARTVSSAADQLLVEMRGKDRRRYQDLIDGLAEAIDKWSEVVGAEGVQ